MPDNNVDYFGKGIGDVMSTPYQTFVLPEPSPEIAMMDNLQNSVNSYPYTHCQHMSNALPRTAADNTIHAAVSLIRSKNTQFDTFAFRGMSGAIFAPVLAHLMHKEMIMVRKNKGNGCASGRWVEGFKHARRYILVDDLICSGSSAVDTILAVKVFTNSKAELVDVLLYDSHVELLGVDDKFGCISPRVLMERAQSKFDEGEYDAGKTW